MSEVLEPGWGDGSRADEAVASWNLDPDARALIEVRARTTDGRWHPWQQLAYWGEVGDRRSPGSHGADESPDGRLGGPTVDTDILRAGPADRFDGVQLRITLLEGPADSSGHPLRLAAVSFSAPTAAGPAADPIRHSGAVGAAASVRPLSQRAYPARADLGGGGPAWCSPTSLTMIASAWGAQLPSGPPGDTPAGSDARVPWVARAVYDAEYGGTGNWSFNVAVAGSLGFDAVATRLSSLRSARVLTEAGIPLVASISFGVGELPGADYDTAGHLLVVRGFDAHGDVLAADPANAGGEDGLRTYPRDAFDVAWSHSRRTVYLIVPRGHALPDCGDAREW